MRSDALTFVIIIKYCYGISSNGQLSGECRLNVGALAMTIRLHSQLNGRDHFDAIYKSDIAMEAEWLRRGAGDKVDSIQYFLSKHDIKPKDLVELGAGTGAVISECQKRKLALNFTAVDFSDEAIRYLKNNSRGINLIQADVTSPEFAGAAECDVLVLSHVVEHLEEPEPFLQAVRKRMNFKYAIIEVPLEDLFIGRLKAIVRDRAKNTAGHVQYFTSHTFESLVSRSGFEIIDRRNYVPIPSMDTLRFVMHRNRMPRWRFLQMQITQRIIPLVAPALWARVYYSHHAVLCRPKSRVRTQLIQIQ